MSLSTQNNILIYGGSFDPPHYGHINTAIAVQKNIHFDRVIFLPCKTPVLKAATEASGEQRLQMLGLAIEDHPTFEIDDREIKRNTPSFMVETLQSFRKELGKEAAITLLLGMDAFMQLPQWHQWQQILKLSHLLVIKRAEVNEQDLPKSLQTLLATHETFDKKLLLTNPNGNIYRYDAGQYPISSSQLRQLVKAEKDIQPYLPEKVFQYIKAQALYT